jgi:hypothetical protein
VNLNTSEGCSSTVFLSERVRAYLEGPVDFRVVVRKEVVWGGLWLSDDSRL